MIEISVEELRSDLIAYIHRVENGETLIITRGHKTIGKIVPAEGVVDHQSNAYEIPRVGSWGGKPLSPWEPTVINEGPEQVSDLVNLDRDENNGSN